MDKNGFVLIGKIVKAHGIGGAVKVCSYAESFRTFERAGTVLIENQDSRGFEIKKVWPGPGKSVILALKGVEDRDQGNSLAGSKILIKKSALPELEDSEYYWADIIGLDVLTIDGQCLGKVESIVETGSSDVYVVRGEEKETLVPAVSSVVVNIDLNKKIMQVNLPEGL